jgi:hypothetical protein
MEPGVESVGDNDWSTAVEHGAWSVGDIDWSPAVEHGAWGMTIGFQQWNMEPRVSGMMS